MSPESLWNHCRINPDSFGFIPSGTAFLAPHMAPATPGCCSGMLLKACCAAITPESLGFLAARNAFLTPHMAPGTPGCCSGMLLKACCAAMFLRHDFNYDCLYM